MSFVSLGLSKPLLKAVTEKGYETPSPIQEKVIPAIITGRDVMGAAQTGTGKTAGFTLPLLERLQKGNRAHANQTRALILTPTRELAAQIGESVEAYGKYLPLRLGVVFGGVNINPQKTKLCRGVDVLVATPGRLLDLFNQKAVKFNQLEVLVLDEADRMLDMGFIDDVRKILKILPLERQNLLFSATFSEAIRQLAKELTNTPIEISVTPRNTTPTTVKQWIYPVDRKRKSALLCHLIHQHKWKQVLVFTRTKYGANRLEKKLKTAGITSVVIHGNKSQAARTKALAIFKRGEACVMVATDLASRGLDINQLPRVINFDLPDMAENYIHRIGRTGRANMNGQAVSLVCAEEIEELLSIERLLERILDRESIDGFDPVYPLPKSSLDYRPFRSNKSRRSKGNRQRAWNPAAKTKNHNPVSRNRKYFTKKNQDVRNTKISRNEDSQMNFS